MGERGYPKDSPPMSGDYSSSKPFVETPPVSGEHQRRTSQDSFASSKMSYPGYGPNPGTYVIQVPKDHIYRVPPPENARKFENYTRKKTKKNCCRCCICSAIATIFFLIVLIAITFGILYLVYHPKAPKYTISGVQVKGVNLTTSKISPIFNVTVKAINPNGKIGIYYEQGGKIRVNHGGVNLCDGKLPAFHQPPNSVTVFSTEIIGARIVLSKSAREKLVTQQKNGKIPLQMDVTTPVRIKIGSVKFWTMPVKVTCDVTVNALTSNGKIKSQNCKVRVKAW